MTATPGPIGGPIGEDDLQAFVDGRLVDADRERVEAYLALHPEARERTALDRAHRDSLRAQLAAKFAEPIPARLRVANIGAARREAMRRRLRTIAAAVALFAAGGAVGWSAGHLGHSSSGAAAVADHATAAYRTFVVEVAHPVEVKAAQEAHLLHWLSKRLGRELAAPDLSRFGYRLMGGRLLPGGNGAAAQLMYDDADGHRLTLYVQAEPGTTTAFRFRQDGNASTFVWIDRGFGFAVTARASREQLLPIAEAVYHRLDGDQHPGRNGTGRS
jgi:anti-sigma factor RsiW